MLTTKQLTSSYVSVEVLEVDGNDSVFPLRKPVRKVAARRQQMQIRRTNCYSNAWEFSMPQKLIVIKDALGGWRGGGVVIG